MADRAQELEPKADDTDRLYDLDDRRDMNDWMLARLEGTEFEEAS